MNKIIHFSPRRPAQDDVRRQACAWLARLDAGASIEDRRQLGQWLSEHPQNRKMFLDVAALWDRMDVLSELSEIFPLAQYVPHSGQKAPRRRYAASAAAVVLVSALFGGLFMAWDMLSGPGVPWASLSETYQTAVGEQFAVHLPDGSEVILNTNSAVDVQYSTDDRTIYLLRGEVHFTVARDENRPFRVHAGNRVVEAVGTAFSVYRVQDDFIEVTVTAGSVNLLQLRELPVPEPSRDIAVQMPARDGGDLHDQDAVSLVAGEYAAVGGQGAAIEKVRLQPQEIEVRLAWRHGMLLFQDDPLEDVLREISRYTTTRIEADAAIRDIRVAGYFRAGDIDALLVAMRESFRIHVERLDDDHILLTAQ